MTKLKELGKINNITPEKSYTLAEVVQETYRLNYRLKESTNEEFKSLVEGHLTQLRNDPTDVAQLSEHMNILIGLEGLGEEAVLNEEVTQSIVVNKAKRRKRPDPERSREMKKAWKKNRVKMEKALKKFRKSSRGKAFYRSLGKFNDRMNDSKEMTMQESLLLFKAGNSALTHLAVELEHNPDFKDTFNEASEILSEDLTILLECIIEGESPDEELLESFQEFHGILSVEDTEED